MPTIRSTWPPTGWATPARSGNFFGVDPLFFQVVVPAGHHLILVLNETATNGGLDLPGDILVEAFADTDFTDLTPRPTAPEPGTLDLLVVRPSRAAGGASVWRGTAPCRDGALRELGFPLKAAARAPPS